MWEQLACGLCRDRDSSTFIVLAVGVGRLPTRRVGDHGAAHHGKGDHTMVINKEMAMAVEMTWCAPLPKDSSQ